MGEGQALRTFTHKSGNWSSLILPLSLIHWVNQGRSLLTSEPQFLHLQSGNNNASQGCCET